MGRADRRRMLKQMGLGTKQKRRELTPKDMPTYEMLEHAAEAQRRQKELQANAEELTARQVALEERNKLRKLGMIVPPSADEAEHLRAKGHQVGAGGLIIAGGNDGIPARRP